MDCKVSVIVPIYNDVNNLPGCFDSVLKQTLDGIEIIAIDDGSSDGSVQVVLRYSQEHGNITLLKQSHKGPGPARNLGIEHARGRFIAFMDADDEYYDENALRFLYEAAERNNVSISGGNAIVVDRNGKSWESRYSFSDSAVVDYRDFQECFGYWRYIFDREMVMQNSVRFPELLRGQDIPFFIEAMSYAGSFSSVDKIVYKQNVRNRRGVFSHDQTADFIRSVISCLHIAKENGYRDLYNNRLRFLLNDYSPSIVPYVYSGDEEIIDLLSEAYSGMEEIGGSVIEDRMTPAKAKSIVDSVAKENERINDMLRTDKRIIIYGAGIAGELLYEAFELNKRDDVSFAVSDNAILRSEQFMGAKSRRISEWNEYRDSARVVIAIMDEEIRKEMIANAKSAGFTDIVSPDMKKFDLAVRWKDLIK